MNAARPGVHGDFVTRTTLRLAGGPADSRGGAVATAIPLFHGKRRQINSVAVLAMLAVIVIDMMFPNNPEKRWLFIVPLGLLWAFTIIEGLIARRPSD